MTVTQSAIHYQLSSAADLDQLVDDLRELPASTVIVSSEPTSEFSVSPLEFARLGAAGKDSGKQLVLETEDEHTASMAASFGFEVIQLPDVGRSQLVEPDDADDQHKVAPTGYFEQIDGELTRSLPTLDATADLATYRPSMPNHVATDSVSPSKSSTSTSNGARRTARGAAPDIVEPDTDSERASEPARGDSRFATRRPVPTAIPRTERQNGSRPHPSRRRRPRREPRKRRWLVAAIAIIAPVVVLAAVAALAAYLLPSASVGLVPVEDTIAADLTYGVAIPGASFDITIDPELISSRTTFETTVQTTGERFEPDGTASGFVLFTNPFTTDVTIPSGAALTGANGVTYFTFQDVLIPAADPFGSLAFGSEVTGVVAGLAGPGGNLDAGSLTGQLATGLFYTNRDPITGGTNRRIAVVTESDVAASEQEVRDQLLSTAESEFLESVPAGVQILPSSIEVDQPAIQVSHAAGDDATEISASGTITVRGRIFDPEALHARANDEAGRRLASQAGADQILLANSVHVAEPIALDDDGTSFVVSASATVRSVITAEEQASILHQLIGMRLDDAEAFLAEHEKIERYAILIEPDWLPSRMPELGSRISVEVKTSESLESSR